MEMATNDSRRSSQHDHGSVTPQESAIPMLEMNGLHPLPSHQELAESGMPFIMVFLKRRLHVLPIVTEILIIVGFLTSYGVAVYHGHVEPDFPYISYTAIDAPERCLFSMFINMGAFLLAMNIYIKYLETKQILRHNNCVNRDHIINKVALIIGFISAFGLSMVANYQTVDARVGHYIGAVLTFLGGVIYCWMQTALSIRYRRWTCVAVSQLVVSLVLTASLITFIASKAIYKTREWQGQGTKWDTLRGVYLTSTISEWVTALSLVSFVLTFYTDFTGITLHLPKIEFKNKDLANKNYNFEKIGDTDILNVKETAAVV